jgi:hypothetical protein
MVPEKPFQFDDELLEALRYNRDLDACGVLPDCREECCPCFLLGRNGRPIDIITDEHGRYGFYIFGTSPDVVSWHDTLEEAVRSNQAALI